MHTLMLNLCTLQQLTKGEESWSLGELCQALCIMTHFHALSSFIHGSGLSTLLVCSKKDEGMYNLFLQPVLCLHSPVDRKLFMGNIAVRVI